ncbi:MAG: AtpZ/AtpI family protein [Ignavibacteriae bacterium]|nr:AtpZ/AtpI family protein [Ignavibacteriota bacterium]
MENPKDQKNNSGFSSYLKAIRTAGTLFGSGIQLAASVVIMFFIGKWLDEQFNTAPWLMVISIVFGVGAGMYNFIKIVNKLDEKRANDKQR